MDIRTDITNAIINLIEQGKANSHNPLWDQACKHGMPRNSATTRPYNGINVPLLWIAAEKYGFARNEWLTFLQLQQLGARLKAGSKGAMGIYFKMVAKKGADAGQAHNHADGAQDGLYPMMKPFFVFNVEQIEGLPEAVEPTSTQFTPIEEAERILQASGAKIIHDGNKAFYQSNTDTIVMPDQVRFKSAENYYAVALHELTHWSGHSSRLARDFSGRFASEAYAFEELVAELGSAYTVAHLGLHEATLENHASYIDSWLRVLKSDKEAVFRAAKLASAASQFILAKSGVTAPEANH